MRYHFTNKRNNGGAIVYRNEFFFFFFFFWYANMILEEVSECAVIQCAEEYDGEENERNTLFLGILNASVCVMEVCK